MELWGINLLNILMESDVSEDNESSNYTIFMKAYLQSK